jgi:hypothetical protein
MPQSATTVKPMEIKKSIASFVPNPTKTECLQFARLSSCTVGVMQALTEEDNVLFYREHGHASKRIDADVLY